ncbi:MAG: 6-carboxytetrahydropterin synthase [Cytophagales bacterium]|nr:MAG: 6-carboxytetrahydropterin synthase [Cytophagales bacterium]
MEEIAVYRKEHFNAAHRLYRPDWSNEQNELVFGKCNNHNFHGHNYELIIKLVGKINPDTGYMIDLKVLSDIIKEHILKKFDHKNLNLDVPEFAQLNPTAENIAIVIYNILRQQLPAQYKLQIKLYETERNFVEYPVSIL